MAREEELKELWKRLEPLPDIFAGLSAQVTTSVKTRNMDNLRSDLLESIETATEFLWHIK